MTQSENFHPTLHMQLHFFGIQAACVRHTWWWTEAKLAIVFTYFLVQAPCVIHPWWRTEPKLANVLTYFLFLSTSSSFHPLQGAPKFHMRGRSGREIIQITCHLGKIFEN